MVNMNVSLPESLKEYVEEQVHDGGYRTVSEYLWELIREDKRRKTQERLEVLLLEGLESGDPITVTPRFRQQLWARVDAWKQAESIQDG